jgi:hypothetical protein
MARVFVTGSADGLGQMAAAQMVAAGHKVVLHARNSFLSSPYFIVTLKPPRTLKPGPGSKNRLLPSSTITEPT